MSYSILYLSILLSLFCFTTSCTTPETPCRDFIASAGVVHTDIELDTNTSTVLEYFISCSLFHDLVSELLEYSCVSDDSGGESFQFYYRTMSDFIAEGYFAFNVKRLSATITGATSKEIAYIYIDDVLMEHETIIGNRSEMVTYTDLDSRNRPVLGNMMTVEVGTTLCSDIVVLQTYNNEDQTVFVSYQGENSSPECFTGVYYVLERFDSYQNLIYKEERRGNNLSVTEISPIYTYSNVCLEN